MNRLTAKITMRTVARQWTSRWMCAWGPDAARYFKRYAKAKTAEKILTEQLEKGPGLTYLESVVQELSQAEAEQDFNDIRAELESEST